MSDGLIGDSKGEIIFGNEAVVRGALEAGVGFISGYPGTPASEISDTAGQIAKKVGIYFEYSTNEKIALEAAAGAAFAGVKSMVVMKHYGLNVALDSLLPLGYLGCPLVVVVADDPGSYSSVQTEQDSRLLAKIGHLPVLEPSNPEEARIMTKKAFEVSAKYKIPVILRMTTRVSYVRGLVNFDQLPDSYQTQGKFEKNPEGFKMGASQTVALHAKILDKMIKIKNEVSETDPLNFVNNQKGKIGVAVSGVSWQYLQEVMLESARNLPVFKIGLSAPFPDQKAAAFMSKLTKVIVIEELEPVLENELKRIAQDQNIKLQIVGEKYFPKIGELNAKIIADNLPKAIASQAISPAENPAKNEVATRLPFLCHGCPHRATFNAVKKALGEDKIYGGDIGCYMIGAYKPIQMLDWVVAMGAGVGIAHGISKTTSQKPVAFIGDSTFFHAGLPALVNLVYNQSDILLIIMDNNYTAMTGHQPNPSTGLTGEGDVVKKIDIEPIVKACGVDAVQTISIYDFNNAVEAIKSAYAQKGVSVFVAKGECRLMTVKKAKDSGQKLPIFQIVKQNETDNKILRAYHCPAFIETDNGLAIDPATCTGCSVCKQLAPNSVEIMKEGENAK